MIIKKKKHYKRVFKVHARLGIRGDVPKRFPPLNASSKINIDNFDANLQRNFTPFCESIRQCGWPSTGWLLTPRVLEDVTKRTFFFSIETDRGVATETLKSPKGIRSVMSFRARGGHGEEPADKIMPLAGRRHIAEYKLDRTHRQRFQGRNIIRLEIVNG